MKPRWGLLARASCTDLGRSVPCHVVAFVGLVGSTECRVVVIIYSTYDIRLKTDADLASVHDPSRGATHILDAISVGQDLA